MLFRYPTISGMRPGELADQVGVSKQAMNDTLRLLERKGYLRLQPDPSDGRARLIQLTERGTALMDTMFAAALELSEEWAERVGRKRFNAFQKTLIELAGLSS